MPTYRCWDPDTADEEDARVFEAPYANWAAERFAESRHAHDDYPARRDVLVRAPDGTLSKYEVVAEPSVTFRAREI